jgi:phosphoenolpyruvate-protein phosphotransferase (PTS system enzyme I)
MVSECANTRVFGTCASPGHAVGPIVRIGFASDRWRRPGVDEADALRTALDAAACGLAALSSRTDSRAAEFLEFQLALLDDESLTASAFAEASGNSPADAAWRRVMDALIDEYRANPNELVQARSLDVADVRDRVLNALNGDLPKPELRAGAIVVAEDLPPSRFLEIDWSRGGGIALSRGSLMSHTAILARTLGVPMVVQTGAIPDAATALLDANQGFVDLDPSDEALRVFAQGGASREASAREAERVDPGASATYRGERLQLLLNIEGPASLTHPNAASADGVGLMRTEFLFLGRSEAPDEDAQFAAYCAVLRWAGARPVTIRTVDAGGDKAVRGLSEESEANPFLGVRGLRLSLRRPDIFMVQLRALGRAAMHGRLKVMFPMVTTPAEFETGRALFHKAVAALQAEGRDARAPELGMMVEVPAAALRIKDFDAAFFSIGANDLTQFVMACDRGNGAVSHLYDVMNPAVIELIRRVVDHGRASGREVTLCGDAAADPAHALELLRCGLRGLSMSPNALAAVKRAILESPEERVV